MSCRSTYAGSAFTSFARIAVPNGISDVATLSAFHAIRADYRNENRYPWIERQANEEAYRGYLESLRAQVQTNTELTDARRASLLARLDQAENQVPDPATIYALGQIVQRVRTESEAQARFLANYSQQTGLTFDEARAHFAQLEDSIVRTRGAGDPETYTQENISEARRAGITTEPGSVHAFVMMRAEGAAIERASYSSRPRRFDHTPVSANVSTVDRTGAAVNLVSTGYDPRSQHFEVVVRDAATGENRTEYYRGVSQHIAERVAAGDTDTWRNQLVGRSWLQYNNEGEALRASVAPRCAICGQFSNVTHSCPTGTTAPVTTFAMSNYQTPTSGQAIPYQFVRSDGSVQTLETRIDLPQVAPMRAAGRENTILLQNIRTSMYLGAWRDNNYGTLTGDLAVVRDPETGEVSYNTRELQCSCPEYARNYHCQHVDVYVSAIRQRLNPPARTPAAALTPEQRAERAAAAQARAAAVFNHDWSRNEEALAEAARTWDQNATTRYSEDYEAFQAALAEAKDAIVAKDGKPAIPYMKENALGGFAQRGSGQAFGMEIEYEFPADWTTQQKMEANARIGAALKAANLTNHDTQQNYHAATGAGFRDYHVDSNGQGTWSWERDGSVSGGELVTPAMYDEPETWGKLEQAVQILKDNGAVATARAGAHVHVGTGMYNGDPQKYQELARLMTQHEDVMFRLAQNPERGEHRQGNYTMPLREVPTGAWRDISELHSWQSGRTRAINFNHVNRNPSDAAKDHPEFRIFDSTLDVGAMQTQIKLSVAMTHAAARIAGDAPTTRGKERIGTHVAIAKARGRRRETDEDIKQETATFRSFVDTLFSRDEDKKQVLALFAATKWNKPDRANQRAQQQEDRIAATR
jgi:hypothetical protein